MARPHSRPSRKTPSKVQGHRQRTSAASGQNLRSKKTKPPPPNLTTNSVMTTEPLQEPVRANKLTSLMIIELEGKVFSDQTGKFPIISSRGNKYIMVMFVEDANAILVEPLKLRSERYIINAIIKLHTYLTDRGFKTQTQILDNNCPEAMKHHFQSNNTPSPLCQQSRKRNRDLQRSFHCECG